MAEEQRTKNQEQAARFRYYELFGNADKKAVLLARAGVPFGGRFFPLRKRVYPGTGVSLAQLLTRGKALRTRNLFLNRTLVYKKVFF